MDAINQLTRRELNDHAKYNTGGDAIDVGIETLRKWGQITNIY